MKQLSTDNLTPKQRSHCMSQIRSVNTLPELRVRSMIHRMGFRFRLHRRMLPGCPDIVLPKKKKVIFVHGCFWHMHKCKLGKVIPKTNLHYWDVKRRGNLHRDRKNVKALKSLGWKVLILWECWTKKDVKLVNSLKEFLFSEYT
jgi:DNA mismatch endonuclease (patch repair protein)